MSSRAASRITGASLHTVIKLLNDAGRALGQYQDQAFRNLPCKNIQVDEIWSFVHAKQKNVHKSLCLTFDGYTGTFYKAPGASVSMWANMQAACASIAERWPNIKPPKNAIL